MKQPNTKLHWTALAIARYYDRFGTACRTRDLYPLVEEVHAEPHHLAQTLHNLKTSGVIDHVSTTSHSGENGTATTYCYYPTPITIEDLRDIGEPTELPTGEPVPESANTAIPTARIPAEEADDIPLPDVDNGPLDYGNKPSGQPSGSTNPFSSYELDEPVATILPEEEYPTSLLDEVGESDDEHVCDTCGDTFKSAGGLGSHANYCDGPEKADETDDEHRCELCGDTFENAAGLGNHRNYCDGPEEVDLPEETEEAEEFECEHCGATYPHAQALGGHLRHCTPDADNTIGVAHDRAYMTARTVETTPEWNWADISNRLDEKADAAHEAGLPDLAATYTNFASLAMTRDLNEHHNIEMEPEAILTKDLVLMLLGVHHSNIDPDVIENEALAQVKAANAEVR